MTDNDLAGAVQTELGRPNRSGRAREQAETGNRPDEPSTAPASTAGVTRDTVPHGPTTPLSDEQPHPGTRETPEREIAAESRAGGPTDAEIEAAARALFVVQHDDADEWWDRLTERGRREWCDDARAILAAALPLVEARLREQIAADSDSMVEASVECPSCGASIRAHVARGRVVGDTA